MQRLRRIIFNLLITVSVFIFIATALLWPISYYRGDILVAAHARAYRVVSGGGGVAFEVARLTGRVGHWRNNIDPKTGTLAHYVEHEADYRQRSWAAGKPELHRMVYPYVNRSTFARRAWLGPHNAIVPRLLPVEFNVSSRFDNAAGQAEEEWLLGRALWMPYWMIAFASAILPAIGLRRRYRRSLLKMGHCPVCGYDLRASPARCPECGTPVGAA